MNGLRLTLACLPYDHVQPVLSGEVGIEGVDLMPVTFRRPMEVFSRMLGNNEFDIAEMSITHCFVLKLMSRVKFVTLPIFPSRMFRHGYIFVNVRSGIESPKSLNNKRIGVQGYQTTAAIWIRGILQHEYGVSFEGVQWLQGGVNQSGVAGGNITALRPAGPLSLESVSEGKTLSDMLAAGEIDALIGPEVPNSLHANKQVRRLFPDYHRIEREYYANTGIFPIMHALVLREELYANNPLLATSIYKAFDSAKKLVRQQARFTGALSYMLPWYHEQLDEIDELFGAHFWPYGLSANRKTLEAFGQLLVEQGFIPKPPRLEDIFVPVPEA